jgi:two-component system phosphate regulon sensor histidine kinase PhoR
MSQKIPKSLLIFYILVIYVLLQFCWWSYLLYDLNTELYNLKNASPERSYISKTPTDIDRLNKKKIMILGEGVVFLSLLAWGMIQTRKSFKKETQLAMQQKNFLLSVTHELKSPIASVKLLLQTLIKRELTKDKQLELISRAENEATRLDQMVENILIATQIENHIYSIHANQTNISELISHITEQQNTIHPTIKFHQSIQKNVMFNCDEIAMKSIILNLLENAIKYSDENPEIAIQLSSDQHQILINISDKGIGISDEEKEMVFNKFYRSGNEETRKTKGTGLGLFIVKYLVNQHFGKISIYDNQPKGSIFEIKFKNNWNVN